MSMPNVTHIVVGCGGSGAKSATRLTQLMSKDPYWRSNIDRSVFFLLVDTDSGDLSKSVAAIRAAAPGVYVSTLHTTRGFTAPYEIIEAFRSGVNASMTSEPSGLDRFNQHWWVRDAGAESFDSARPFTIPQLNDVTTGAGQIPMLSYLATWFAMKPNGRSTASVESVLDQLITEIGNRKAALEVKDGSPLDTFNVMFVGSMAGGTGRGCAIPIAFKMKEMFFREYRRPITISSYFLNEDCFEKEREPHETLPQMMNAMTGWSELSAWITHYHRREGAGYRYSLPGLGRPDNPAFDALGSTESQGGAGVDDGSRDGAKSLAKPFDSVGVICRTNGTGFSVDRDEIYPMVAVSLYLDITESAVKSKINNQPDKYFSVGSSIVEVPFEDIENFFADKAVYDAAMQVQRSLPDGDLDKVVARILGLIGFGTDALEQMLKPTEDTKTPLQKLAKHLRADKGFIRDKLQQLLTALEDQDAETAAEQLKKILSDDSLPDLAQAISSRYVNILVDALSEGRAEQIAGIPGIVEQVAEAVIGKSKESLLSVSGSAFAVDQTARRLSMAMSALFEVNGSFSDEAIAAWKARAGRKNPHEVLEATRKRNGILGFGKRFSPEEIDEVISVVAEELLCMCARALAHAMGTSVSSNASLGLFKAIEVRLTEISDNAKLVCSAMKHVVSMQELSLTAIEKKQEQLFAGERLESVIPTSSSGDTGYLLRRQVRPVMPEPSELLLEATALKATIGDLLRRKPPEDIDAGDMDTAVVRLISKVVGTSRYMYVRSEHSPEAAPRKVLVPIVEAFTLRSVLRELTKRMPDYFSAVKSQDRGRFERIRSSFSGFFGLNLVVVDDRVSIDAYDQKEVAGEDFLLLGMATIAARTCAPFWRTKADAGQQRRVTMLLPVELDSDRLVAWEKMIERGSNLRGGTAEIITGNPEGYNPYVLVVYANSAVDSLDQVTSVDAWSKNPVLRNALALSEKTDPVSMPFRDANEMWPGYRGSGFTDPVYVQNRELASCRWRPWAELTAVDEETDKQELTLALAYGWVGPEWFIRNFLPDQNLGGKTLGSVFKFGSHAAICIARKPHVFQPGYTLDRLRGSGDRRLELPATMTSYFGEIPNEDEQIANNLDGVYRAIVQSDSAPKKFVLFGKVLIEEYKSFFREIGDPIGFDPDHDKRGYERLIERWKVYVSERLGGKITDSEHPQAGGITDDDVATGSDSAKKFWGAVATALAEVQAKNDARR